jgi:hypothetical protein
MDQPRVVALVVALTGAVLASRSATPVVNVVADSADNPINAPLGPINAPRELFLAC